MLHDIDAVWLYAYSPRVGEPTKAYYTLYFGRLLERGRAVMATVSLSYLATLSTGGAGARIKDYRTSFGGLVPFADFAVNSVYAPDAISVTYALSANGAEGYAQGNLFYLS